MFNGKTSFDGNATAKTVGDWILFHPRREIKKKRQVVRFSPKVF